MLTTRQHANPKPAVVDHNFSQFDDVGMLQTQKELDFPRGGLGNSNLRVINLQLIHWCACDYPLQRHRVSGGNVDGFEDGSVGPLSCALDDGIVRKGVYASIWP